MKTLRSPAVTGARLATRLALLCASAATAQQLPAGGTTNWEIRGPEEIVTFALFDPDSRGITLPVGLRFVAARNVGMTEIREHLKRHPEHAEWAFSIVEITRHTAFLIDGKAPELPANGGIGLWFAPVDSSGLAAEIDRPKFDAIVAPAGGAVLGLGIWVPDHEYVAYMRSRGHHAEYGSVTLSTDGSGAFRGEIRLDDLSVLATATPHGAPREEPAADTQLLFAPGHEASSVVVIAGSQARHRDCAASWSLHGEHPLSRAIILGPTYLTTYDAPLKGSAYRLRE